MKSVCRYSLILLAAVVFASGSLFAYERTETFEFDDVQSIDVKTVCGGLEIVPGEESRFVVVVENRLDNPRLFKRRVEAKRGRLVIDEDFLGRSVHGGTDWTIYVPKSAEVQSVEFSTASGGFTLDRVDADFVETDIASGSVYINDAKVQELDLSTASGSVEIENCQADRIDAESASGNVEASNVEAEKLELSTASGSVRIRGSQAERIKASSASGQVRISSTDGKEMYLSSASGKVRMDDCRVGLSAEMSCASGDVLARLSRLPSDLLHASTASGDVLLEVADFGENFTMTLTKRADRGRIRCPFEYTDRETFRLNRGDDYLTDRYVVQRGSGGPEVELSTASGTIRLDTDARGE
jgi:DUF4097 and DUF4098 domain-containing protein YvlB